MGKDSLVEHYFGIAFESAANNKTSVPLLDDHWCFELYWVATDCIPIAFPVFSTLNVHFGDSFLFLSLKKSSIDRSKLGGHGLSESVTDSMSTKNLCYRYVPFVDSGFATKLSIVKFVLVIFRFFEWSTWSEKIEKRMKRSNWEEAPQTFFIDFETTINNPQLYFDYINIKSNKYFVLPTSFSVESETRAWTAGRGDRVSKRVLVGYVPGKLCDRTIFLSAKVST